MPHKIYNRREHESPNVKNLCFINEKMDDFVSCYIENKEKCNYKKECIKNKIDILNFLKTWYNKSKISKDTKENIFRYFNTKIYHRSEIRRTKISAFITFMILIPIKIIKIVYGLIYAIIKN